MGKYVLEIDKPALDWLTTLISNAVHTVRPGPVNHQLISNWEHHVAWDDALKNLIPYETAITIPHINHVKLDTPKKPRQPRSKSTKTTKAKKQKPKPEDVFSCSKHPNYHGLRASQNDCDECWELYGIRKGHAQAKFARDKLRKRLKTK